MSSSKLNQAIVTAIRRNREASGYWEPVRRMLAKQLETSERDADEILVFIEATDVDQYLQKERDEWAQALDPEWPEALSKMSPVLLSEMSPDLF